MKTGHFWLLCSLAFLALAATLVSPATDLARHLGGQVSLASAPLDLDTLPARDAADIDTAAILAFAPFGDASLPETVASTQAAPQLNITLQGVLVSKDETESRALISVAGNTDFFEVGDVLVEGATLTGIEADAVVVSFADRSHRYGFAGALGSDSATGSDPGAPDTAPPPSATDRLGALLVPGHGSLDLREAPPPETTAEYVALWRKRIIDDPISVLDTIGLVPGAQGYTISKNPNIGVTLAGLKPGDLVTRVNGQTVGDPDRDRAFYDEIAASGHARLEVIRDGAPLLMSFPLR